VQVIRSRLYMQLTDRVLLPATVVYTDSEQNSTSPCAGDAAQSSDGHQTEPTVEAGHTEVCDVPGSAADNNSRVDEMAASTDVCSTTVAVEDSITGCMEANKPASAANEAEFNPTDTAGSLSVMTVSLVSFPSDIHDAAEVDSVSLLQPLPTAVHIDDTLMHSVDSNILITESTATNDDQLACAGETEPTRLMLSNHANCSEVQQPTEWTRYFLISFFLVSI